MKKPQFKSKKLNGLTKEEFNEQAKKVSLSYASSCVSQETRSKAGKIGSKWGTKNLEAARTTEHQKKAGKRGGQKNAESGHIQNISSLGANAAKSKFTQQRIDKLEKLYAAMQPNTSYTFKELDALVDVRNLKNVISKTHTEWHSYLIKNCTGRGATATYTKKEGV